MYHKRHAMEFETVETYMTFDELGGIKEILPRTRNDKYINWLKSRRCSPTSQEYALKHDVPMLYRVHEPPEFSRIQKVRDFVKLLGCDFQNNQPSRLSSGDWSH